MLFVFGALNPTSRLKITNKEEESETTNKEGKDVNAPTKSAILSLVAGKQEKEKCVIGALDTILNSATPQVTSSMSEDDVAVGPQRHAIVSIALTLAACCIGFALLVLCLAICTGIHQTIPRFQRGKRWTSVLRKEGAKPLLLLAGVLVGLFVGLYIINF